jgi:magnesium-transporting ATPase (P-type)
MAQLALVPEGADFDAAAIQPWATVSFLSPNQDWPGQSDNFVRTTRYTPLTFLPLTLFENFRVATNIYFLIILIMSWLPWTPVSYILNLLPLIFVLAVSMIKSGIEDILKYAQDRRRNNTPVKIYRYGEWVQAVSKDIHAGDLILEEGDAMVACDMLYVTSSQATQAVNYSEVQLNGESAVKTMVAHPAFKRKQFPSYLLENQFSVELPEPTRDLTRFDAKMIGPDGSTYAVALHNVLLRAMNIYYTDWVMGIALTTGHDTNGMKNVRHPPAKRPEFDRDINKMIIGVFVFKIIIITIFTVVAGVYENNDTFPWVDQVTEGQGNSILIAWMQYFVLYSYLIPISLMVTVEIIRLFHMFIVMWDRLLVDGEFGSAEPHNSNQIGQLGAVTHVLSDKTGTLTENVMELIGFTDRTGSHRASAFAAGSLHEIDGSMKFLMCLAACNTVIVYHSPNGTTEYNAESPDEAAFVQFAANCGVVLVDRQPDSFVLDIRGTRHTYDIVSLLPFDSTRKRMTVVVSERGEDKLIIYSKGADSIMFDRVVEPMFGTEVNEYAIAGLRTLIFACRSLGAEEAADWRREWHAASSVIVGRDDAIAAIAPHVESRLKCVGASAVEDRLQPHVADAIAWLRAAKIRIWVLTGDKLETAIEIGRTSAVIGRDSEMLIISQEQDDAIAAQFEHYKRQFYEKPFDFTDPVLVLTAKAAELALSTQKDAFLEIAGHCKSVIFSRVSPFQKASIVALVKQQAGSLTLAIGDGANDVGMLQEAHVGIGVKGREGSQAAQSSDFAIPRFRHLVPLIGVQGHWAGWRLTHVSLFMLYKNFAMIMVYMWSSFDTLMSPTDFYDEFLLSFFNLLFTLLPPFAYGFWERDCTKRDLLKYPQLYNGSFNPMRVPFLLAYFGIAIWQSIVVYYIVRFTFPDGALQANGNLSYICIVCIIAFQFLFWSYDWNWLMVLACALTIVLLFSVIPAYAYTMVPSLIAFVQEVIGSLRGWAVILACLAAGVLPYLAFRVFVDFGWPSLDRLIRERERPEPKVDGHHEELEFWELMKCGAKATTQDETSELELDDLGNDR